MWNVIDEDNAFDFEGAKAAQSWRAKEILSEEIPPEKLEERFILVLVGLLGITAGLFIAYPLFSNPAFIEAIKSMV